MEQVFIDIEKFIERDEKFSMSQNNYATTTIFATLNNYELFALLISVPCVRM
jgi:hypothetical protein